MKLPILVLFFCMNIDFLGNNIYTKPISHLDNTKKEIALTFDDGPSKDNTLKILSILKKYNIKATFFVLGESIEYNKDVLKKIYFQGHQIGIHSNTHPNFATLTYQEIKEEILICKEMIYEITGYNSKIIRPPYGKTNDDFFRVCYELNLTPYTWSLDSLDWCTYNSDKDIIKNVCHNITPGAIVLMHDKSHNSNHSRQALPSIIKYACNKEYKFVKLEEMD